MLASRPSDSTLFANANNSGLHREATKIACKEFCIERAVDAFTQNPFREM